MFILRCLDISEGMLRDTRRRIQGTEKSDFIMYQNFDCHRIPYEDDSYDLVIANHVLFYCEDVQMVCREVRRVLSRNGRFVCSTYGSGHMKEVSELVQEFDERIVLSADRLYEKFGKENGREILAPYFSKIEWREYEDYLLVEDPEPLISYILSCHGNQGQYIADHYKEFRSFVKRKVEKGLKITKEAGIYVCDIM